jgi:ABC-type transport system involved in multi-copper enzyme maturation permease subunit
MFGTFFIERDPPGFKDVPEMVIAWTQNVGVLAALGVIVWVVLWECRVTWVRRAAAGEPAVVGTLFRLGLLVTVVAYGPTLLGLLYDLRAALTTWSGGTVTETRLTEWFRKVRPTSMTVGGACAILTASVSFLVNLPAWRVRRVWAQAKLSFKEAVRRRVLFAFLGLVVIYLFGSWFIQSKGESQVRTYVTVVYWGMGPLLILASIALAAFSIPADIKQQTIHTIVTKPVERFEIILGRFLGFAALMTLVLAGMTVLSLLYVLRGVDPDAAAESLKAREALYGDLRFEHCDSEQKGGNVGKEWDYRGYITGSVSPSLPKQTAVWELPPVPAAVADRKSVRCEFTFDIYRTTKGTENRGVVCSFYFCAPGVTEGAGEEYARRLKAAIGAGKSEAEAEEQVAEEMGFYQKLSREVTDNHTQSFTIPGGLLRTANKKTTPNGKALTVRVVCNDLTQYVGMAKFDFYVRADDPDAGDDRARFVMNFFKGATGLWLRLMLVIGLAVALSTWFSGVIALLVAMMVYVGGLFQDFIAQVAEGSNPGGGPLESLYRLSRGESIAAPLEQTATIKFANAYDVGYRWVLNLVIKLIPDVDQFDLTSYVAEGFNIGGEHLVLNILLLVGYLLPCGLLAYYLLKWREIAAPT